MRRVLTALFVTAGLLGCQDSHVPRPSGEADAGLAAADTNAKPVPTGFTHVISVETEYYRDGPQQGRPPDGRFDAGTKLTVLREAGSYSLVRSADGSEAYVSADALQKVDSR